MSPRYTVIWKRALIERKIAALVVELMEQGGDVQAVTRAMAEIDHRLEYDPETQGESRADYERVLMVSPLSVTFEVHEEERIVYVLRATYMQKKAR